MTLQELNEWIEDVSKYQNINGTTKLRLARNVKGSLTIYELVMHVTSGNNIILYAGDKVYHRDSPEEADRKKYDL